MILVGACKDFLLSIVLDATVNCCRDRDSQSHPPVTVYSLLSECTPWDVVLFGTASRSKSLELMRAQRMASRDALPWSWVHSCLLRDRALRLRV